MTKLRWPRRVWTQGVNGKWTSREPTREDTERRDAVDEHFPKRPPEYET